MLLVFFYPHVDVGRALHDAFSQIGFVFVTNHGVPLATVRDLFASSKKFFELDRDAKEGCPMTMMGGKACQVHSVCFLRDTHTISIYLASLFQMAFLTSSKSARHND